MNTIDKLLYSFITKIGPSNILFRRRFNCEDDFLTQALYKGIGFFILFLSLYMFVKTYPDIEHHKELAFILVVICFICFYFICRIKYIKCDSLGIWLNEKEKIPWGKVQKIYKITLSFQKIDYVREGKNKSIYVFTNYDELMSAKYKMKIGKIRTPETALGKIIHWLRRIFYWLLPRRRFYY